MKTLQVLSLRELAPYMGSSKAESQVAQRFVYVLELRNIAMNANKYALHP